MVDVKEAVKSLVPYIEKGELSPSMTIEEAISWAEWADGEEPVLTFWESVEQQIDHFVGLVENFTRYHGNSPIILPTEQEVLNKLISIIPVIEEVDELVRINVDEESNASEKEIINESDSSSA